jgi:hypothetical protein
MGLFYDKQGCHKKTGYNREGYNREGYDLEGYNRDGYNLRGYDREGYDLEGYDLEGYDLEGYNREGYNRDGYTRDGYTRDGYDRNGFNGIGLHKNGTTYDDHGYDREGYDRSGFKPAIDFHSKVAGVTYENRQQVIKKLKDGDALILKREPNNPYDKNAIAVLTKSNEQVGYIGKDLAIKLAPLMDDGAIFEVNISKITGDGHTKKGVNIHITSNTKVSKPKRTHNSYEDYYEGYDIDEYYHEYVGDLGKPWEIFDMTRDEWESNCE